MEKIVFYGTRGSCSLTSNKYLEFGGATTCIMLNLPNTHIMIDSGSGINNALEDLKDINELHLFISHCHLDHIVGIGTLLEAFKEKKLHIYGKTYNGVSIKDAIDKIMSQQLWPVRAETYKNVIFHEVKATFKINNIVIKNMDSNHPGGCTIYRFESGNDAIVTAFDFCHLDGYEEKLIDFSKGCSTLIYDGCMNEEDFAKYPHYGHSTPEVGLRIGEAINCKNIIITHFGVYDDEYLSNWESSLKKKNPNISFARSGKNHDELKKIVEIGTLLSSERDTDVIVSKVVETAMEITNADGGTLYLLENNKLEFKVLINKSKNTKLIRKEEALSMPSVSIDGKNVCAASARDKKLINISNCYFEQQYDFSGTKEYDKLNNYLTKSVLVIPLIDDNDDVVGVLQLINAIDKFGEITEFKKEDEDILMAIANQASMSIVNTSYSQKISDLLYGFIKLLSVQIDERTPYNANHTRNMVKFAERFLDYENNNNGLYSVDDKKKREILMSIWLHDIGKILTPIDIMNKDSRLGELTNIVETRFERRELLLKLFCAENKISKEEYNLLEEERINQLSFIRLINKVGFLTDEYKNELDLLSKKTYIDLDGSIKPVITSEEHYQLSIIKGTLTKEERFIMEGHVSYTQKFLSQLNFPKHYENIPSYAGNHHEFLNGTGYPNKLTEHELDWPCRLITICDIFEALIAKDRPYKKPMPIDKALSILHEMASEGKLDLIIILEFEKSHCWE